MTKKILVFREFDDFSAILAENGFEVINLPLITTNCAVLGIPLINVQSRHNFIESLLFGMGGAIGFTLVLVLFAGIRERLDGADVPGIFKGSAIAMITAGLMSLAFMGFSGLDK